ncbi:proteasome assembly chaperone 2 [Musca vetustissima]|uniref:proteasome assembly chaperone 2 n=1 Tax=Musca vetustissima TaxID=27455 RepID=UPI002AB6D867|nr:proteasome assembly chaperone 2 [Musca vetustissima]
MMLLQFKQNVHLEDFKGYTVIVPSICIGNAAQLACDLLISSKNLKRVGSIIHPALIPCYGPSAFQHEPEEKIAACEVYSCQVSRLLVFQFRSPFISTHMVSFQNELANLLKIAARVIILSGSLGFEKRIIDSCPYEYKASDELKEIYGDRLSNMKWKEFKGEMIFGGGNALELYKIMEEQKVPVMILFRYLLEGDNSTDAALILSELTELCKDFLALKTEDGGLQLKVPISWKLLFGNDIPELIF